jgi:hypothetical protein
MKKITKQKFIDMLTKNNVSYLGEDCWLNYNNDIEQISLNQLRCNRALGKAVYQTDDTLLFENGMKCELNTVIRVCEDTDKYRNFKESYFMEICKEGIKVSKLSTYGEYTGNGYIKHKVIHCFLIIGSKEVYYEVDN